MQFIKEALTFSLLIIFIIEGYFKPINLFYKKSIVYLYILEG